MGKYCLSFLSAVQEMEKFREHFFAEWISFFMESVGCYDRNVDKEFQPNRINVFLQWNLFHTNLVARNKHMINIVYVSIIASNRFHENISLKKNSQFPILEFSHPCTSPGRRDTQYLHIFHSFIVSMSSKCLPSVGKSHLKT